MGMKNMYTHPADVLVDKSEVSAFAPLELYQIMQPDQLRQNNAFFRFW